MKRLLLTSAACLSLFISSRSVAGDPTWLEGRSAHFAVVSDTSQRSTREILRQFEQVRFALHTLWPWADLDLDRPILVLAVRDETDMKALVPEAWERKDAVHPSSMLVTGADRHYIALRADLKSDDRLGVNPYNNAYWSYASLIVRTRLRGDLPPWLTIGIAAVMSNINVTNSTINIGEVIPWHLQRLHAVTDRPRLSDLVKADQNSPWMSGTNRPSFDAVAWAFVHYLMFGEQGVHQEQLNKLITLLLDGKKPSDVLAQVFGDIDALSSPFAAYLNRPIWMYARVKAQQAVASEAYPVRPISSAEALSLQAAFHVWTNRLTDARASINRLGLSDGRHALVYDTEGMLDETERKQLEAQAAYGRAIELGSTSFYSYYRWAMLMQTSAADDASRAKIEEMLTRATELNDRFAPAHSMLAMLKLQRGHHEEAVIEERRAVALQPDQIIERMTLVRILMNLNRRDEAEREVAAAMVFTRFEAQRQQLQELLKSPPGSTIETTSPPLGVGVGRNPMPSNAGANGLYRAGNGVVTPRVVREVKPQYTREAMQQKVQGSVLLECVVKKNGTVGDVKVARSLDPKYGLDLEAMRRPNNGSFCRAHEITFRWTSW